MRSLWNLTKKNLRLLLRAKSSALIVFLAPLLIILILGLSYNTSSQYGLIIGVYSTSFTDDVNSLMDSLQEQEFKIVKYENSTEECVEDIKLGYVHTCLSLPENFKVESNTPKEVSFYVDPSKINLVWMVQETLQRKFNLQSQQISQEISQNILTKLTETKTKLSEQSGQLSSTKEKSSSAFQISESVKQQLNGIDLSKTATTYDLKIVDLFKDHTGAKVSTAITKITSAIEELDSSNISSSEKSSIKKSLSNASENLQDVSAKITGSGENSLSGISSLISSLDNDLKSTEAKLTAASASIASSANNVDGAKAMIQEIIGLVDGLQASVSLTQANLDLKITEASTIANPLITKIEKISPEGTYLNYTFSILLIIVIMFSSLLLGTTLVMMEKHSPAFFRNSFLPVRKTTFIFSIYLTNLILILIQIIVILGVSLFFMKESLPLFPQIALILFISASVFTFLGMCIGYIFDSEETGVLASISTGSLLLFLSGVILPLESVSPLLRNITYFNPFVIAEKLIRQILLFKTPLSLIWMDIVILTSYVLVLFLVILVLELFLHQHIIKRYLRNNHQIHRQKDKQNKNDEKNF